MYTEDLSKQSAFDLNLDVGQRIQAHPATDTWMRGDRWGTIQSIGRKFIHVKMDRSGRTIKFHPANLLLD